MKRIVILWMALIAISLQTFADEKVSFTTSAPEAVAVGDQFRLSYTVTTQKVRDFRAPSIKGFEVLSGPSRAMHTTTFNSSKEKKSTYHISYNYSLKAMEEGEFPIPGAVIIADGREMVSNSIIIKVLPSEENNIKINNPNNNNNESIKDSIADDDLFIIANSSKIIASNKDAVLLTYKIYTKVNLRGFNNVKLPDFKGFHSQEVELPNDRRWGLEHYKGRNYQTIVYRQFVLFPQQLGNLTIEQARFDASIAVEKQVSDPFEAFFNGEGMIEVKKTLMTPKQTINMKDLPVRNPEFFSSGIGEFNISSSISTCELTTKKSFTLKLNIYGVGDISISALPTMKFPNDFIALKPKTSSSVKFQNQKKYTTTEIEYTAIPQNVGIYRIPSMEFYYYDIKAKVYRILKTEEYVVNVNEIE